MNITLFITKRCAACERVTKALESILNNKDGIELHVEDIRKVRSKGIIIVPAIFIEDELYAYGDIDEGKFLDRLHTLSLSN
jgi:predicted thioredoxin/glutaredoxin